MTNLPCDLIRDLLPLYLDGVCSEESKAAVEAHLEGCEACKAEYQRLLDAEQLTPTPDLTSEKAEEKQIKALRRVKRNLNKKRLAAVLLTTVAVVGIVTGLLMLASATRVILPYDETKIRVEAMTPENAKKAMVGETSKIEDMVDLQVSEEITEYYSYLTSKNLILKEDGKTIHVMYCYFSSSLPDYLAHGGKGNFRERRLQQGLEDSFSDGIMHWGLPTTWSSTEYSDDPVEPGFVDGYKISRVETPPEPGFPYIVTKEAPLDRIYYITGPHFSLEFSDDQKIIEQNSVLIWEREK